MRDRYNVTTRFDLSDGRELVCRYKAVNTPDSWECPGDWEPGEPDYTLDGKAVTLAQMPKGLEAIADKLAEAGPGEYGYKAIQDYPDYY